MVESISRVGIERQTQRTNTRGELREAVTYIHGRVQSRQLRELLQSTGSSACAQDHREGWGGGGKEVEREATYACL